MSSEPDNTSQPERPKRCGRKPIVAPRLGTYGVSRVDAMLYQGHRTAEIYHILKVSAKGISREAFRAWVYHRRRRLMGADDEKADRQASATALAFSTYAMLRVAAGSALRLDDVINRLARIHARRRRRAKARAGGEATT